MRQYDDVVISNYYLITDAVDRQEERILMDLDQSLRCLTNYKGE